MTVADRQSRGVTAMYDADDAAAAAWIGRVQEIAPELWERVAERRKVAQR